MALITGAARGIGAATARLLLASGAKVVAVDIDPARLRTFVDECGAIASGLLLSEVADVADPPAMRAVVSRTLEKFGRLDCAVLNAGIEGVVAPIDEYPVDQFEKVLRVNVRGVWCGLQAVIPGLETSGGGSIVIVSSISGVLGFPGVSAYTASKHAVIGIMRTAALELAAGGIRVNAVAPGFIDTRMTRDLERKIDSSNPSAVRAAVSRRTPLGRYADPLEVARLVHFLVSDAASFCTGALYPVDGGFAT